MHNIIFPDSLNKIFFIQKKILQNQVRLLSQYKWNPIQLELSVLRVILKYLPDASQAV